MKKHVHGPPTVIGGQKEEENFNFIFAGNHDHPAIKNNASAGMTDRVDFSKNTA